VASLQKTATRDLSTAIAGKIWEAIKDADEKRELEKSKASEEVKKAAVKIKRGDTNSIPVRDKDLRETVVKIFGPIEGRLLQTEGKVSNISGKITTVAGGIADTQKLIINQNQILEDKFDQILNVIGTKNHLTAKLKAENDFKQLELNLEKGLDLSGTFAYEKAGGRSGFGVMGALLSGILGNRMTARLVKQLYKKIVPKGLKVRARLLGKSVRPFGRAIGVASRPLKNLVKLSLTSVLKAFAGSLTSPKRLSRIVRVLGKGVLGDSFRGKIGKKGFQTVASSRSLGNLFRSKFFPNMIGRAQIFKSLRTFNVDRVATQIISEYANAATVIRNRSTIARAKKFYSQGIGKANLSAGRNIMKKLASQGSEEAAKGLSKKGLQKGGSKVAVNLTDDILSSKGLIEAFNNPIVQKRIATKLGPEALQEIGIKLGAGGLKSVGVGPGTLYALGEGLMRLSPAFGGSDSLGMALSFGSAIPWAGWGVAILDILRDIDREAFDTHILPNAFALNEEHIANFFKQALDIDQLERGNVNFKPSGGMGGTIDSISEILGVTKAFGDATGFGPEVKGLVGQAGLDAYPTGKSNYKFDVSGSVGGGGSIESTKNKDVELRKKETYKDDDNKPIIDDDRSSGEKIGDMVGATIDEVDTFLDPVRKITGGKRDDGQFTIFGLNIRNPLNTKPNNKGGGGIGGDDTVQATTPIMGGDGATIEFWGQQGRDLSGEPGVDFSYKDYRSNYNLFPGYVLEKGLLYGARYGNVVVVRSVDPSNGLEFDSLYSHFPDGGMAVKTGQMVSAGEYLGKVGFVSVDVPGVPQMQPNNAGNMSGWHTSVDFFEPGSSARYRNLSAIQNLVTGADGQSPVGLLEKLKPPSTSNDQSSLNNIESNSNLASTMTNMVEKGSSERMMTKRKSSKRLPIVIINNQVINTSQTQVAMGNSKESSNFFEAYNLARYTV